ncbi:hypothetical protein AsAng_0046190 [Aureispira anguillae]|uniref:Uncharacterized protein n=1 Tax=Aureispira anguillae TaxID=2864201 RepID=A0A916DVL6_9BACT|nr:hypothetical protein AsAng_0046190 [Aureispira anguillae]
MIHDDYYFLRMERKKRLPDTYYPHFYNTQYKVQKNKKNKRRKLIA